MIILLGLSGELIALALTGASYQIIATESDKRNYPAPGQMVDVGGYRLHLMVMGEDMDGPTVVLEAGTMQYL
jgi:hypothetical protein